MSTNMKHTPGPWTAGVWETTNNKGHFETFATVTHEIENGTAFICDCCGLEDEETHGVKLPTETARANAQLISAAPDMLSALQHACEMLVSARVEVYNHDRANYERCEKVISLCWAVLNKATNA